MVQGISSKGPTPTLIPYWRVDAEAGRPIDNPYISAPYLDYFRGTFFSEGMDRIRIRATLKAPLEVQVALLEDTESTRGKILEFAWQLHLGLQSDDPQEFNLINESLSKSWQELETLSQSKEVYAKHASNILELRKTIHQLKVIALKRGEGPTWVDAQIHDFCRIDPLLSLLLLPIYYSQTSIPEDPVARLQDMALKKGYRLYFGPYPLDPLLGRPEFLALRWVQDARDPENLRAQWGVLSEDGFFNTKVEALQRMTSVLGLYTLPEKSLQGRLLEYARLVKSMHDALHNRNGNEALKILETAQVTAQNLNLALDPAWYQRWRSLIKSFEVPQSPLFAEPKGEAPILPQEQQSARSLECDFPMWKNLRQELCLAFWDYSGKKDLFDGHDQWGIYNQEGNFESKSETLREKLKLLGLESIPRNIPYSAMDKYVGHFNRAYQISRENLTYPSGSLHQVIDDLRTAHTVAKEYRLPINLDRFRRVTQDALMLFWDSAPGLFTIQFPENKVLSEEEVGTVFTARLGSIEKEKAALKVIARLTNREILEMWAQFFQVGKDVLEDQMKNAHHKAPVWAQYTLRLLLAFLPAKELEVYAHAMKELARKSSEAGQPERCFKWLTSADLILQPLGERTSKIEFNQSMRQAYLQKRTGLVSGLEAAAVFYQADLEGWDAGAPAHMGSVETVPDESQDRSGAGTDLKGELGPIRALLKSWEENARNLGEDSLESFQFHFKDLRNERPQAYGNLVRIFRNMLQDSPSNVPSAP